MAHKTTNTTTIEYEYVSQNGTVKTISIPRPKEDLTDTEYYNAACRMIASNACKPDGTPLKTISEMQLVEKEETSFDIDQLAAV